MEQHRARGKESCWWEVLLSQFDVCLLSPSETPSGFEWHPDQLITCAGIDFPCFTHLRPPPLSATVTSQNKPPAHKPQCPPLLFQESLSCDRYISLLSLPYKVPQAGGLKQQKVFSAQFWRLEAQDPGASRVGVP